MREERRLNLQRSRQLSFRLFQPSHVHVQNPKVAIRIVVIRSKIDRLQIGSFGFVLPSLPAIEQTQEVVRVPVTGAPPDGFTIGQLPAEGLDVATEMAWEENGMVQTELLSIYEELRPRGELAPIPEPSSLLLLSCGLAAFAGLARRRRSRP